MSTPSNPPSDGNALTQEIASTYRVQLEQLQTRIGIHGSRLWQLPLTYIAAVAFALSEGEKFRDYLLTTNRALLWALLIALDLLFGWCMVGAHEGYSRTAGNMIRIEKALGVEVTTRLSRSHWIPYFGLLALAFGVSGYVLWLL